MQKYWLIYIVLILGASIALELSTSMKFPEYEYGKWPSVHDYEDAYFQFYNWLTAMQVILLSSIVILGAVGLAVTLWRVLSNDKRQSSA